jgi:integrase
MKIRKRRKASARGGWLEYWQLDRGLVNGKRVRTNYKTRQEAENALSTAKRQRQQYGLDAFHLPPGVLRELMEAHNRLDAVGAKIGQAVDHFLKYHQTVPDKTLSEGIVALMQAKRAANLRPRYLGQLEFVLNRFATGRDNKLLKDVTKAEIEEWLNGNGWAPKTRKGYLVDVQTFFKFCAGEWWLMEDPAAKIQKPKLDAGRPAILTADQCAHLMQTAQETDPGLCAYLALALFAGIRPEEVERLPVSAIDLKTAVVRIPADVSKTRRERDVTIELNLKAWLKLGIELPVPNFKRRFDAVRKSAGLFDGWAHDVMRHTFGSFHVGKYEAIGKTALQMGNSEPIIKAHYLDHVRDKQAVVKFWNIKPNSQP